MALMTFSEALDRGGQNPKILLGNGFSQACKPNIFSYGSLFERADFSDLSDNAREAFTVLETTDFELVMDALKNASSLLTLYDEEDNPLVDVFESDANGLREVLVSAIAGSHPAWPGEIEDEEYWACRRFLANFDRIYSVNYDLLLYWATMHDDDPDSEPLDVKKDDGFRTPEDGTAEYVTWEIENTNSQRVFYLHGALHLFDAEHELQKYTWCNTGIRIIDQVREALERDYYPLFVAEGQSEKKLAKINHSNYLSRGLRSFSAINGSLFVYGHSFADSDNHILRLIRKGRISNLFVSIYGDEDSGQNREIMARAEALNEGRPNRNLLNVFFYNANSAAVWG